MLNIVTSILELKELAVILERWNLAEAGSTCLREGWTLGAASSLESGTSGMHAFGMRQSCLCSLVMPHPRVIVHSFELAVSSS